MRDVGATLFVIGVIAIFFGLVLANALVSALF
jgi:hypothetical protein